MLLLVLLRFIQINNTGTINVGSRAAGIPYNRIGKNSNGADKASGDFYEVILYNNRLSIAEKVIVENYLSAKLGSIAITNNFTTKMKTEILIIK